MIDEEEHEFVVVTTSIRVVTMVCLSKEEAKSMVQNWADEDPSDLGTEALVSNQVIPIR